MKKFIAKAATKVSNAAGGKDLVDWLGTKIAQRKNPSIQQTTSGKAALKSAGKVAGTVATVAGVGGVARAGARALAARTPKSFKISGQARPVRITPQVTKGRILGGRGNAVGRSGTSYKPYR